MPKIVLSTVLALLLSSGLAVAQALQHDLRAVELLRNGTNTPLDAVDELGAKLLLKYEAPEDQAQIRYQLAHVHAQSGLQQPAKVIEYATAALDSKLVTPEQRGTLYSYLSSAHEVDRDVKDFAVRRRKAIEPLLAGLAELQAMRLPEVAPEPPVVEKRLRDLGGEGERPGDEAIRKAEQLVRERAERIRALVSRRNTLQDQVKWLYYREPIADDELKQLASDLLNEEWSTKLLNAARSERARIEGAQKARDVH